VARPRTYIPADVVEAAKQVFWEQGYEATGIADLAARTGLGRSSLYHGFGDKRALFAAVLDSYSESFIEPLVEPMERESADIETVASFFMGLRNHLLDRRQGRRGCLLVNTIAELSRRDGDAHRRAVAYRDRLHRAFANALGGRSTGRVGDVATIDRRSRLLAAATFGVWLSARIDPVDAAGLCDEIVAEVESWR